MKEVQAIVNSRPLALNDMSSPDSAEPLTPNHLLTMSKVLMPPPGVFIREDIYLRKRWRRVQHLANVFWERRRKEFLQTLQLRRKKWVKSLRNMLVGEIVVIKDDNASRNMWKLARVEDVFTSEDGLVRKVKLAIATRSFDKQGQRIDAVHYLERPVHKLVLIQESDRNFPDEEPR